MSKLEIVLLSAAIVATAAMFSQSVSGSPAWYGPGSGPVSPYANYQGFAQVPRQPGGPGAFVGRRGNVGVPSNGTYRCVPNVGLVGPNGICPD